MIENGFVKSTENGLCEVIVKRKTACGENCASCSGMCNAAETVCVAENNIGAKPGDFVSIEMQTGKVLKTAFLVYILPIIVFFAVFGIISRFSEIGSYLGGAVSMILTFILLCGYDKKSTIRPYVSEIIKST